MALLGFFGVAPDVQINVQDFGKPLPLAFVLLGGTGDAVATIEFQLVDEANHVLLSTPPRETNLTADGKRLMSAVGLSFVYPGPGRYRLRLLVDRQSHFDAAFELLKGTPEDFQF